MDYSQDAHAKLVKCKALSGLLCDNPLTLNINKCILVSREAAMWSFTANYPHALLGRTALSLAQGINSPQTITDNLLSSVQGPTAMSDLLKHM